MTSLVTRTKQPPPLGGRRREQADLARLVAQGKIDAIGAVTLTANAATTTVSSDGAVFATETSVVLLSPRSANAAAALSGIYFTLANGQFVIHHANNAQVDRTFGYAVLG